MMFLSQLGMFKTNGQWLEGQDLMYVIGLIALTMTIMVFLLC